MDSWILPAFWLALAVVLLIAEVATVSLISLWFVIGAAAAFVLSLLQVPFWMQALAFVLVSAVLFVLLKEKVQDFFRFRHDQSGAPSVLGHTGTVSQTIDPQTGTGRVLVCGQDWKARADRRIETGSTVRAIGLQGVTLEVCALCKGENNHD